MDALRKRGISLWDVLKSCSRPGSLDSAIKDEVPNDFRMIFKQSPLIKHICFNGSKAEVAFKKHILLNLPNRENLSFTRLPSTSPARANLSYAEKLEAWQVVAHIVKHETV